MPIDILWRYARRSRHSKEDMTDVVTDKIASLVAGAKLKKLCHSREGGNPCILGFDYFFEVK